MDPSEPLVVACLCAQWCDICTAWREHFDALAARLPGARWVWIDVEDQAERLGDWEPENFPVLAVQRGATLLYCAALPQHEDNWLRVIDAVASGPTRPVPGPDLRPFVDV